MRTQPTKQSQLTVSNKIYTLRGTCVVMPLPLIRQRVLQIARQGHPGIVKKKTLLPTKVWWPGVDKDEEKFCRTCHSCQLGNSYEALEPIQKTKLPQEPWQDLALDYLGPLPSSDYILVLINYYS